VLDYDKKFVPWWSGTKASCFVVRGSDAVGYHRVIKKTSDGGWYVYYGTKMKEGDTCLPGEAHLYNTGHIPSASDIYGPAAADPQQWSLTQNKCDHRDGCTGAPPPKDQIKLAYMSRRSDKSQMTWWHTKTCSCEMEKTPITFTWLSTGIPSGTEVYGKKDTK